MVANLTLVYQCLSLRIFFDHNPICHGGRLTLFLPLGYLGNPSMTLTSKAKVLVSLVRSCKYLHTFSLLVMGPLNPIQDGLSANLFGTGGGGFRPPLSSRLVGPEGPQNRFPRKVVMYMRPTKKKLGRSPKNWGREPQFKIST